MTHSPLTNRVMRPQGKYYGKSSSRFGVRVRQVVVHHWATTGMAGLNRLVHSSDKASVNYLILDDGTLISSVPEERRAWTSGSGSVDRRSITVEIQNATGAPSWKISAAAMATLTRLSADVAKRYGFSCSRSTLRGHREFAATACPGPFLYPRLDDIARDAEAIRRGGGGASRDDDRPAKASWRSLGTLRKGSTGSGVKLVQRRLHIEADGKFGPLTEKAVKADQRSRGLDADGVVGGKTWTSWLTDGDGALRKGDHNVAVPILQRIVGVREDSKFGPNTEAEVKKMQRDLKVDDDGVVGPATRAALVREW